MNTRSRHALLVILITISAVSCSRGNRDTPPADDEAPTASKAAPTPAPTPANADPTAEFWRWFAESSAYIYMLESAQDDLWIEIGERLARIHPGLVFELSPKNDSGRRFFAVSGNRVKEMMPIVEQVVDAAPELRGWYIVPFRPVRPLPESLELRGASLATANVRVSHEHAAEHTNLVVYIEGLAADNEQDLTTVGLVALEHVLGEYDLLTKVGEIRWQPLSKAPKGADPVAALDKVFRARYYAISREACESVARRIAKLDPKRTAAAIVKRCIDEMWDRSAETCYQMSLDAAELANCDELFAESDD